jgi:Tfp pilus assembly protein PilZ
MLTLVVIAKGEPARAVVARAVEAGGGTAIALSSLAELPAVLRETPVSGILLEMVTSARASAAEKQETNDLIQLYAYAKFKVVNSEIKMLGRNMTLEDFLQQCLSIRPRMIRKSPRVVIHAGVYISKSSDFSQFEKSVTLNISNDGCFVYSACQWQVGERVWLLFKDQEHVMSGEVRWRHPWGKNNRMPGIGIRFIQDGIEHPCPAFLRDDAD